MLPRRFRLGGGDAIKKVKSQGFRSRSAHFLLQICPTAGVQFRAGAVVPSSAVKSAVLRNRTRRRMYAALHAVAESTNIRADILLTAFRGAEAISSADIVQEITPLFDSVR